MYMNIDEYDKRKKGNVGLKVKGARLSVSHGKGWSATREASREDLHRDQRPLLILRFPSHTGIDRLDDPCRCAMAVL